VIQLVRDSLMITGFVAGMMLLIEYLNVLTSGHWGQWLRQGRLAQYLVAAALGAIPGCLGAFTAVTLYSHGVMSFGSVAATMIAASGDEAFVMLALIPRTALAMMAILFVLAVIAGFVVDLLARKFAITWPQCEALVIHQEEKLRRLSPSEVFAHWKDCSAARGILSTTLALLAAAIATGQIGPPSWDWVRISLIAVSTAALFVVATVPDHFLEEHLWRHVARKHVPRIFLWTLGALALSGPVEQFLKLNGLGHESRWLLLLMACAVGLIPESGPHLIFVTLYAQSVIPFGVLLASSIVQDGHGMLPMLAHSRRAFIAVKAINFALGLTAGAVAMSLGF
jgi:hypothetical protein